MAARALPRRPAPGTSLPLAALPSAALLLLLTAAPAQAAGYRYWSYWERSDGHWSYATQGPSTARPGDGDTIGFRYAVSDDSQDAAKPRGAADFDALCTDTPASDGHKRIAVVIDFGTTADARDHQTPPARRGACARVDADASSADALAAVATPLRYNSDALLCGIAGYPKSGCAESVDGPASGDRDSTDNAAADGGTTSSADDAGGDTGGSAGLIGGIAAVAALGAAAVWQARRRRA